MRTINDKTHVSFFWHGTNITYFSRAVDRNIFPFNLEMSGTNARDFGMLSGHLMSDGPQIPLIPSLMFRFYSLEGGHD